EEVAELAAAGLAEVVRRQVADGIHLHASDAKPRCFLKGPSQGQAEGFQSDAEFQTVHALALSIALRLSVPTIPLPVGKETRLPEVQGKSLVPGVVIEPGIEERPREWSAEVLLDFFQRGRIPAVPGPEV